MYLIFLSHSSIDKLKGLSLKRWLLYNSRDDVFPDLDPGRGLKPGGRWQEAWRQENETCG
jgi:hypothetical protein